MDNSLIIYSGLFTLVSFVLLRKFLKKSIILSLLIPLILISIYFIYINGTNKIVTNNDFDIMTDMPNF